MIVDHFSRRAMGFQVFHHQPTSLDIQAFFDRVMRKHKTRPTSIVCDREKQFDCKSFRRWCKARRIQPSRYGAVGQHGSIAVVERFILTMKTLLQQLVAFLITKDRVERELAFVLDWYNEDRPHETLKGKTPNEVYFRRFPGCRKPRFEPRSRYPRGSPCAKPGVPIRGHVGQPIVIDTDMVEGRKHLPIVSIRRAA